MLFIYIYEYVCVYVACTYIYIKCKILCISYFKGERGLHFTFFSAFSHEMKKKRYWMKFCLQNLRKTPSKHGQESNTFV